MRVLDEDMQTGDDFIMLIQWSWSAPQWAKMTRQNREVTFSESSAAHGPRRSGHGQPR